MPTLPHYVNRKHNSSLFIQNMFVGQNFKEISLGNFLRVGWRSLIWSQLVGPVQNDICLFFDPVWFRHRSETCLAPGAQLLLIYCHYGLSKSL